MPFAHVLVGLGNPGSPYRGTRHNAGAEFIEKLARRHRTSLDTEKYRSRIGVAEIEGRRCLLAVPMTYMNLSGQAVKRIISFTNSPVSGLVVTHDDLDLPPGRIRLRKGGGAGGHRGVQSVIDHLQTSDFMRIKIGIGRPPDGRETEAFVLGKLSALERAAVSQAIDRAIQAVETLFLHDIDKAMSLFNRP